MELLPAPVPCVMLYNVDYCHLLQEKTEASLSGPQNNVTVMSLLSSVKEAPGTLNGSETNDK